MAYTLEDLMARGAAPVARLLITKAKFFDKATYGEAKKLLEGELQIDAIFPIQIGHVVGHMMHLIQNENPEAPLLNVLMVNAGNGFPGIGADEFIDEWSGRRYSQMSEENRAKILANVTRDVWAYQDWDKIYKNIFGKEFVNLPEADPSAQTSVGEYGGPAESDEHRRLKEAIAGNPKLAVSVSNEATTKMEAHLKSSDEVDVRVFDAEKEFAIEVKSIRSTDADLERGIYQAVKYLAVINAEYQSLSALAAVEAVLVTERPLPARFQSTAKLLGVKTKVVHINIG